MGKANMPNQPECVIIIQENVKYIIFPLKVMYI